MTLENGRTDVRVSLGIRSYTIAITSNAMETLPAALLEWMAQAGFGSGRSVLIVTDKHLAETHADVAQQSLQSAGWKTHVAVLEPGEPTKSLAQASALYDQLVDFGADRQTCVIAVGGGVVGDLAGFVAATYARGLPFVQIPTSLLAQVDSSVGGKVGVNHPRGKNLIGAFHQPLGVFIDTSVLNSLPIRDYRSGMAEVIKYGVILDAEFFDFLEQHIDELNNRDAATLRHVVAQSCRLKADVVEHDEFERTGIRAALNYGHTFAHAFEALCGYGELMHGEAVGIGMLYASRLAEKLGRIDSTDTTRQRELLSAIGLPVALPSESNLAVDALLDRMRLDKKTVGGQLRFVLPTRIGKVEVVKDVSEETVREVLDELRPA